MVHRGNSDAEAYVPNLFKIIAFSKIASQAISINHIQINTQEPLSGGFSGAEVRKITIVPGCPAHLKGIMVPEKYYVLKIMHDTKHRGMEEEVSAYEIIEKKCPELRSLYAKRIPTQERNVLILEYVGDRLLAKELLAGHIDKSRYDTESQYFISGLIRHVLENQVSPEVYYKEKYRPEEASLLHYSNETSGLILKRFKQLKLEGKPENIKYFQTQILIDGKMYENPLLFFLKTNQGFSHYAETEFTEFLGQKIQLEEQEFLDHAVRFLLPRTLSLMPTDPSSTNEVIPESPTSARVFDPGRFGVEQFGYPFSKHEGPFAQLFLLIVFQKLQIELSAERGYEVYLDVHEKVWQNLSEIHTYSAIKDRIKSTEEGETFLSQKPFLMLAIFFFGCRQFGSDMLYRSNDHDRMADMVFFTLGMNYIQHAMKQLDAYIAQEFPQQDLEAVIRNPDNFSILSELESRAFQVVDCESISSHISKRFLKMQE